MGRKRRKKHMAYSVPVKKTELTAEDYALIQGIARALRLFADRLTKLGH